MGGNYANLLRTIKDRLKLKEEITEQIVYDALYGNECPVCKNIVEKWEHYSDNKYLINSIILHCPKCHNAFWGVRFQTTKTRKKYKEDETAEFGLRLISEEKI